MLVYNITFVMEPALEESFVALLREEYLSALLSSGAASAPSLTRVVPREDLAADGEEAVSVCLQMRFEGPKRLGEWQEGTLAPVLERLRSRFGDRLLYFPTLMRTIDI